MGDMLVSFVQSVCLVCVLIISYELFRHQLNLVIMDLKLLLICSVFISASHCTQNSKNSKEKEFIKILWKCVFCLVEKAKGGGSELNKIFISL